MSQSMINGHIFFAVTITLAIILVNFVAPKKSIKKNIKALRDIDEA